jgi:hypothetical protein
MSEEPKRRAPGSLVVAAVFLGIVVLAYIGIELVQRHRFTVLEGEAHAVVIDFAASVRFDLDENKRLVLRAAGDSRGAPPLLTDLHWEQVGDRGTSWFLVAPLFGMPPQPASKNNPFLVVFVDQTRGAILGPPKLQVHLVNPKGTLIPEVLEARFKARGLSYSVYTP